MVHAEVLESLADVLVKMWPADRLLVGMGACKSLREILLNAPHAVLSLHQAERDRFNAHDYLEPAPAQTLASLSRLCADLGLCTSGRAILYGSRALSS
jgi:hypothetical protein